MTNDKLLFLDIDGVLVTGKYIKQIKNAHTFCPDTISELARIINNTNCKIVISSTWRFNYPEIFKTLDKCDPEHAKIIADVILGPTPILRLDHSRGIEIQTWMTDNDFHGHFVIVDDDSDMNHLMSHLIKTKFETGLTSEKADDIINYLNKGG
jgi:hypothetical protein